jgi:hypothetical protein
MTHAETRPFPFTKQEVDKLRTAISDSPFRPFLVTLDRSGPRLTAHVATETTKAFSNPIMGQLIRRDFSRRISELGLHPSIRIRLHGRKALDKPRSLEAFTAKFGAGEQLLDPTGAFNQAERLVEFARGVRCRLEGDVKGIYWSSRWRTIYVLMNEEAILNGHGLPRKRLINAERSVVEAHAAELGRTPEGQVVAARSVRLCFSLPALPVVPVDEASFTRSPERNAWAPRLLSITRLAKVPTLSALLGISSAGIAAAKILPIQNTPIVSSEHSKTVSTHAAPGLNDPFLGGPGLHMLWRDPIHGAVGRNASFDQALGAAQAPKADARFDGEHLVSRDQLLEVANLGATFTAAAPVVHQLDLTWLAAQERLARGETGGTDRLAGSPRSNGLPPMQPGMAAVTGLSMLIASDLSNQVYRAGLEDTQAHFGLPLSLQVDARWHFDNSAAPPPSSNQSQEVLDRNALTARGESYWEWLRRAGPATASIGEHDFDSQFAATKPKPKKPRRPHGSST